jgi:hypothetical protein
MHHVKTYTIVLIPTQQGIRAICPALADCTVNAPTRGAALDAIESRIKALIADAVVHNRPIPVDRTSTKFLWVNTEEFLV